MFACGLKTRNISKTEQRFGLLPTADLGAVRPQNGVGSGEWRTVVEKTVAFRHRRAAHTARWRERLRRGAAVYPVEVDGTTFDLMERFGELRDSKIGDRQAVATALGKLLRRALESLLREEAACRR